MEVDKEITTDDDTTADFADKNVSVLSPAARLTFLTVENKLLFSELEEETEVDVTGGDGTSTADIADDNTGLVCSTVILVLAKIDDELAISLLESATDDKSTDFSEDNVAVLCST